MTYGDFPASIQQFDTAVKTGGEYAACAHRELLRLIDTVLDDISRGVASGHHLHNVCCGIENILALLEYNNELVEKADKLLRRAGDYITYRGLATAKINGWTIEDSGRLRIAREALAHFRFCG